ncbi:MAG: response regulator transcription factor [Clostridiales bacterium]|nr:response regulator transcription factor [Clostridiales bacterium]
MATLLIADDNKQILSVLERYAVKSGYQVLLAEDGQQALDLYEKNHVSLVLLDVMMPYVDGFEVCRRIRKESTVPIILITARGEDFERIMGLDIGADDYIVKPFSPGEVMARIRAVLRRMNSYSEPSASQVLTIDNLRIDLSSYAVTVNGEPVKLARKAVEILWTLASRPRRTFTRDMLLQSLWGEEYHGDVRAVDSQVKRMRMSLQQQPHPNWDIKTIWGVGYQFEYSE